VRALETYPKNAHWKLQKVTFVSSWAFECSVKRYETRLSTECYFITTPFKWALLYVTIKEVMENQGL
jgi:hypothetical protein